MVIVGSTWLFADGFRENFVKTRSQECAGHLKKRLGFLQSHACSFEELKMVVLQRTGILQAFRERPPFSHASSNLDFLGGVAGPGGGLPCSIQKISL